ncbi:MAG: uroporphyrinogen-III C-methyltransferase, partial [Methylomonas sp.]|nr:uroporphyrinogen-III C-methyltransferase [Methylomonas sp.]
KSLAGLWIGIISIVLVIGLGVAGFYVVQQMRTVQDTESNQESLKLIEVDKEINGLQNQLTNLQSQIANLNTTLSNKDDHFNKALDDYARLQNERLDTTRKDLEAAIKTIQQQIGKTRGDWLLADADYLLSIANQRLHLVSDVETTRLALEAADQRLRESGDPAVFKVREQIAKEIALLNNVVVPDIVGIYAGLQHLQDAVEGLSVFLPHAGKQPEKAPAAPDLSEHGHELLGKVAKQLEGYVVLRHTEQPVSAILTPEEAHFIKQQLKVRLEMIEIALVQQNDTLFKSSITDARQWLKKNFAEDLKTEQFAAELDKLLHVALKAQLPDISLSSKLLKDINKLRIENDKAPSNQAAPPPSPSAESAAQ